MGNALQKIRDFPEYINELTEKKKKEKKAKKALKAIKGEVPRKQKKKQIGKVSLVKPVVNKPSTVKPVVNKPSTVKPVPVATSPVTPVSKKAILIGLNYPGSHYSLNGCVNDVKNGRNFLQEKNYDVKMLVDEDISKSYNILEALTELGLASQKVVFFHYSGHGTQSKDLDNDEEDKLDEVVYSKNDVSITDDDINKILAGYGKDKTVFLIFDCCHSGSIADLPYILNVDGKVKVEKVKKAINAKVICISGCRDNQTSADMTQGGVSFGALSSVIYTLLRGYKKDVTWRQFYADLVSEMKKKKYEQYPILSASDASYFDLVVKF